MSANCFRFPQPPLAHRTFRCAFRYRLVYTVSRHPSFWLCGVHIHVDTPRICLYCLKCTKFGQLIPRKIIKIVVGKPERQHCCWKILVNHTTLWRSLIQFATVENCPFCQRYYHSVLPCCHQMSDFNAKMHQIRFQLGLCPHPDGKSYSAPQWQYA